MVAAWQAFVERAIEGAPDDPFVAMLRRHIAAGSKIVRIHLDPERKPPEYRVLLERLRQLSEVRIPHSASFTRWSLDAGARLASAGEEAQRFALLARERFEPIAAELGGDYAQAILVERLRALGPPRTVALLSHARTGPTVPGRAQARAARLVDGVLTSLAADLGQSLRYNDVEAAAILDGALEGFMRERFGLQARELSSAG